jgi:hypothetical protein
VLGYAPSIRRIYYPKGVSKTKEKIGSSSESHGGAVDLKVTLALFTKAKRANSKRKKSAL